MSKPPKKSDYSREREFKVILEDLQSQFGVFGEGLAGVREDLTDVRLKVERLEEKVDLIHSDVSVIKSAMATKKDLEPFEKRLALIEHSR